MITLSFSAIDRYTICPAWFKAQYLEKRLPYEPNAAAHRGTEIHKQIEEYIKGNRQNLPEEKPQGDLLVKLKNLRAINPEAVLVEHKYSITETAPCGYFDKDCILRGNLDVMVVNTTNLTIIDWKTGKKGDNSLQAATYAVLVEPYYPDKPVTVHFNYLSKGKGGVHEIQNSHKQQVWDLIGAIYSDNKFCATPNRLCGWCPLKECKYAKSR